MPRVALEFGSESCRTGTADWPEKVRNKKMSTATWARFRNGRPLARHAMGVHQWDINAYIPQQIVSFGSASEGFRAQAPRGFSGPSLSVRGEVLPCFPSRRCWEPATGCRQIKCSRIAGLAFGVCHRSCFHEAGARSGKYVRLAAMNFHVPVHGARLIDVICNGLPC